MTTATTERLGQLAIAPSGFVFDPTTGSTFTANVTGRVVIEGLRDGDDLDRLIERIEEGFEADAADLRRDVLEYVRILRDQGLLPADFELE